MHIYSMYIRVIKEVFYEKVFRGKMEKIDCRNKE